MKVAHSMRCFKSLYSMYGASSVDDPKSCGKKMAIATLLILILLFGAVHLSLSVAAGRLFLIKVMNIRLRAKS